MKKFSLYLFLIFFIVLIASCSKGVNKKKFSLLSSNNSGIKFNNKLIENDTLNYFTYPYIYMGGGVSTGDINNDDLVDIYFTGNMVENKLYLNKGNMEFEDISNFSGIQGDNRWYTGSTMVDINNDGLLDIYCSVGGKFSPKNNELYINNGTKPLLNQQKNME